MDCKVILKEQNTHARANIFSKTFFLWSFKLFHKGHTKGLSIDDLTKARDGDRSGGLGDRLERAWETEVKRAQQKNYKPSFSRAIVRAFWLEYMIVGVFLAILYVVLWPFIPFTLALFIAYFSGEKTEEAYINAHIHNFLMNLLSLATTMMLNHLNLAQSSIGMKVRVASCSLMYRKILKLGRDGLTETEPGQVINLMSNDVNRFDLASQFLNYLWIMPIGLPVICYQVWQHIGWATLAALTVILVQTVLIQAYLSNLQGVLRGKIAKRTDERVRVMGELLNGVQVIKMYAWEKPFQILVATLRRLEVSYIMRTSMIKGFSTALTVFTERFVLFAAIVTFVALGGDISPEITFSLVQYFNLLQLMASICFPLALSFLAEAKVSIQRIEDFLLLNEFEIVKTTNIYSKLPDLDSKILILSGLSVKWNSNALESTLKNINLTVFPGEFVGITGLVGSGKSSLLQTLLGELPVSEGTLTLGGATVSYASQEPWLFVATVRHNILFGLEYEPIRYKKVVKACALLRDFEQFPAGDATLVGERGVSLSGGQRARIGLARACYRQADIYLLDDPLSAVDTLVGKQLISGCVQGLLKRSTRLLVTHQLHHLKSADNIVIINNGEIEVQGTFDEVSTSALFANVLQAEEEVEQGGQRFKYNRTISVLSQTSTSTWPEGGYLDMEDEVESDEMVASGRVSVSVYKQYFSAGSGWFLMLTTALGIFLAQVVTSTSDLWLTYWMNVVEYNRHILPSQVISNKTLEGLDVIAVPEAAVKSSHLGQDDATVFVFHFNHSFYIYIWAGAIVGCIILTTVRSILFLWMCMRSSIKLHNDIFGNILRATMNFFDTNTSGRILNRFSKDMGVVDEILPKMYLDSLQIFMVMIGILVMVAIVSPYMIITTAVCGIFMFIWTAVFLNTAQAIKRVEGVTRSPMFSHVAATMAGLRTVRACKAQKLLRVQFDDKQDINTAAWHLTLTTNTAFSIWLSFICTAYVTVTSYTFLLLDKGDEQSGNVGLAISQGLILVNMVQYGVKQATEVISLMTNVERVIQFKNIPVEDTKGPSPPKGWPHNAKVVFKDLSLRYVMDADPVLKELNVEIESGWKVGVVGRTGAGKSSLISALFRLAPTEGHIYIDGIDTSSIALQELRSKISIIPQEPVLFSASLRYNLDPFDKHTDAEIWLALEQVELKKSITSLDEIVMLGGGNFSAGERQLLCLARAALGRNKILVLDEATANVDPNTDALIQKSIRKHFSDCTVITVAHRLHTVADANRVIVMEAGEIIEFGHPHELLKYPSRPFSRMVRQLGHAAEASLREFAADAYQLQASDDSVDATQVAQ